MFYTHRLYLCCLFEKCRLVYCADRCYIFARIYSYKSVAAGVRADLSVIIARLRLLRSTQRQSRGLQTNGSRAKSGPRSYFIRRQRHFV